MNLIFDRIEDSAKVSPPFGCTRTNMLNRLRKSSRIRSATVRLSNASTGLKFNLHGSKLTTIQERIKDGIDEFGIAHSPISEICGSSVENNLLRAIDEIINANKTTTTKS